MLQRFGYDADLLTSDLDQNARERIMDRVRAQNLRFLVTTDVAARGIDIPSLSHVIQYEVPEDPEIYVHRAGRTGRAGATGVAIIFIGDFSETVRLNRIREKYNIEMEERPFPTPEDVTTGHQPAFNRPVRKQTAWPRQPGDGKNAALFAPG
ncbi:MAG: C-terminal helicase domain-containing protein [Chloroflexi bacterium]|nr:C-terminal helicase domain-containing protein [Chloroflexota bacterium]